MSYNIPYSFIPGTKARAQEVNANFKYVLDSADELNRTKLNTTFSNISTEAVDFIKNCSSSRNIGEIITSPLPLTDDGVHLLDGTLLFYGVYKEFIDYIADLYAENPDANYFTDEALWQQSVNTYGVCGKFVYDSVNNTVRLPKITGIIEGTVDVSALGDLVEAGLPNIEAWAYFYGQALSSAGGSFTRTVGNSSSDPMYASSDTYKRLDFNASLSNPIYGNSSTVQPQTIKVLYYIVVATTSKTEIQSDIDEIATDLNGKADTDLTNVTDTGYIKMAGASMPSNTYIGLTLGASGTSYTAPANGWFSLDGTVSNSSNNFINLVYDGTDTLGVRNASCVNSTNAIGVITPARKGDNVRAYYLNVTNLRFRFIYAQGSESEAN